jgi:hypothetical protein
MLDAILLLVTLAGGGEENVPARLTRVALVACAALAITGSAAWVLLEKRGRPAWRGETERVLATPEGPYRATTLRFPRWRAPLPVRIATLFGLLGAAAALPWLGIGVTELLGGRSPLVLATSIALVATGYTTARACADALARTRPSFGLLAWLAPTAVVGIAASALRGALDRVPVEVHGLKGTRQMEPLGQLITSDGIFASCDGHAGPVWHAMILLALVSAGLLLAALTCAAAIRARVDNAM